jgi:D-alanine--poly(phosphoribitol) ligase subunit 1
MMTVAEHVLRRARQTPDRPAVLGTAELSYGELAARAVRLASTLRAQTPPGSVIASEAATGHAGAVALLAAGAARRVLLPVDLAYPAAYREAVMRDARVAGILREDGYGELSHTVFDPGHPLGPRAGLERIAYVIYTSGSTGKPKGVVISHAALLGRLSALSSTPGLSAGESMLAMSALSFDVSIVEVLLPLYVGGLMVSAPVEARRDPDALGELLKARRPDVLQATPSYWRLAVGSGWQGIPQARLWSVGEALTGSLAGELLPRCRQLWNLYGPTEATIYVTSYLVRAAGCVHLGDPLPGTGLFLAGGEDVGEIVLFGAGLAEGYLDREDLTAERFPTLHTPGGQRRCYRTGDRARRHPDGELEFLGRMDDQVKVHGYRVELGHVESVFEAHPEVREVAALLLGAEDHEPAQLVAAVVAVNAAVSARRLREWAAPRLPRAMIPERFFLMERPLPRTSAGKVDRVALRRQYARSA